MKPVSDTAFYCCGVRMVDAASPRPVLGDTFAERFMEGRGLQVFEQFRHFDRPNASNVARARLIDDLVREELAGDPERLVVTVGAGFDTRPYRLGAGRWVELDEPAVMALKDERLPVEECPRPLTRVAIDFETESLAEKLAPIASGERAVVIVEGVLMYLTDAQRRDTLSALVAALPGHVLFCDLLTKRLLDRSAVPIPDVLAGMGAVFRDLSDEPGRVLLGVGYEHAGSWSTVEASKRYGLVRIPWIVLWTVLRPLVRDYRVHRFEAP